MTRIDVLEERLEDTRRALRAALDLIEHLKIVTSIDDPAFDESLKDARELASI